MPSSVAAALCDDDVVEVDVVLDVDVVLVLEVDAVGVGAGVAGLACVLVVELECEAEDEPENTDSNDMLDLLSGDRYQNNIRQAPPIYATLLAGLKDSVG